MSSVFQQIFQAQSVFQSVLLALPNVVGVAVGYKETMGKITDEPALVILVEQKKPVAGLEPGQVIPKEVNGIPTDVYEAGRLQAQQVQTPRDRFRPTIPGGVSIGHYKVTAGTLGAIVRDRTTGERFILSNNHVLANSNEALIGDPILQPGPTDGGINPNDIVARLERFIMLKYLEGPVDPPQDSTPTPLPPDKPTDPGKPTTPTSSGCDVVEAIVAISNMLAGFGGSEKRVQAVPSAKTAQSAEGEQGDLAIENDADCALARPLDTTMFSDQIRNIGVVRSTMPPALGMRVRKSGRTTDYTESIVTLLNATVNIAYNTSKGPRTGRFVGQIICDSMSQGGDSGSLVVDATENKAVGLLFAGSPLATVFTPIDVVLNALNVDFGV